METMEREQGRMAHSMRSCKCLIGVQFVCCFGMLALLISRFWGFDEDFIWFNVCMCGHLTAGISILSHKVLHEDVRVCAFLLHLYVSIHTVLVMTSVVLVMLDRPAEEEIMSQLTQITLGLGSFSTGMGLYLNYKSSFEGSASLREYAAQ